jgi:hypothetical protein
MSQTTFITIHRVAVVVGALFLTFGCDSLPDTGKQTPHQAQYNSVNVSTNLIPQSSSQNDRESATTPGNNNAGSIIAMIGNGIAAPFKALGQQFDYASGHKPTIAVANMENRQNADWRRLGIFDLVNSWDYAKRPPYTTRYQQIAKNDPDFSVRAAAIRALNIARDQSATPIFIAALDDDNELVRL